MTTPSENRPSELPPPSDPAARSQNAGVALPSAATLRARAQRGSRSLVVAALLFTITTAWIYGATSGGTAPAGTTQPDSVATQPATVAAPAATANAPAAPASAQQAAPTAQPAQPSSRYPFLATFNADLAGTYAQTNTASDSSTTVDARTSGDITLKLHIELVTTDDGGQSQATVTVNKAQLLDVDSNTVVCDGQLTSFNRQLVSATCDGAGPYQGIRMTFEPILSADTTSTVSGSLSGTMERTQ